MSKDWTGNKNSIFKTLGASNHTEEERQKDDYYATDPLATKLLLELEDFKNVLEPACGEGHISTELLKKDIEVFSFDKVDRGYGLVKNFMEFPSWNGDIVTNPPYKFAKEFAQHALQITNKGAKIAMFLKLTFLESQGRVELFKKYPPKTIYVSSNRLLCSKNGLFKKGESKAVCYAWFIWENGYTDETILKWFNIK